MVAIGPGVQSQVASDGSRVSYILAYGLPDSTVGGEVQYQSARGPSGWTSWQLTAPAVGPIVTDGTTGDPGSDVYLSDDLTCGFTVSNQALTANAPTQVIEAGGVNLFRRGSDGDYTVVTPEPANPRADPPASGFVDYYKVEGASPDCDRAFFRTNYRYDGVTTGTGAGPFGSINGPQTYMYEWRNGELAPATVVPSPSGLVPALDATPGWYNGAHHNAVSADGRRLFFTATSQQGADVGKKAVFLREGDDTIDVSQSENGTVNQGARYQDAAEDGSKVYFLANYGLTAAASNGPQTANCSLSGIGAIGAPCTLYEYDVQTGDLTDLTATTDPVNSNGPVVAGVLDVSDTGSHVYFAARAQLVDGEGKTYAQNIAGTGSYNLYVAHGAETDYVANVSAGDVTEAQLGPGLLAAPASTNGGPVWSSQSTPDGEALVFAATGNVTGFDGGDVMHVYRYSADSGGTACVSCRRDGKAPVGASTDRPLATRDNDSFANYMNEPRNISADGSRVFFRTADVLAVGAVEGNNNLYEWHDGQIALLATRVVYSGTPSIRFMGASVDGDSAVFSATGRFTPDDMSDRRSVYVARVGANPTEPSPTSPPACDPLVVGSCTDSGRTPSAPGIETETSGEGPVSPPSRSRLRVGVLTVAQRARLARGKGVELTVRASRPGLVAVVGRARIAGFNVSVVRASARATKAGMLRLPIRLSRPARSALRSTSRLRVGLRVSQAGTPAALVRTAIVIERPPERRDKQVKRVSRRASASATSNQGSR